MDIDAAMVFYQVWVEYSIKDVNTGVLILTIIDIESIK